jgi:hypothetical protein
LRIVSKICTEMRRNMIARPTSKVVFTGTITLVDAPNRALRIRLPNGYIRDLTVSSDCHVALRGEAVRLRLLVAGDEVEISAVEHPDLCKVTRIEVLTRP